MKTSARVLRSGTAVVAAVALVFALVACGNDEETSGAKGGGTDNSVAAPSPNPSGPGSAAAQVTVTATEYAFDMPETLPEGETTFNLVNAGKEPHMLIIAEFKPDAPSIEKLINLTQKEADKYIVEQKQIPPLKPGATGDKPITFDLKAGATYGYVCFVPSPKDSEGHGKPHAFLGMYGTFTVE
jgi:hypothetical protein